MTDNFMRKFLRHRGFSNDMAKAVDEKTQKTTEEMEQYHREVAAGLTKVIANQMMPLFRKRLENQQKQSETPEKKIIIPGE